MKGENVWQPDTFALVFLHCYFEVQMGMTQSARGPSLSFIYLFAAILILREALMFSSDKIVAGGSCHVFIARTLAVW